MLEEINQECLIELIIHYIMQIFNIHKQAKFTKHTGHVSPIVYRIERSWTKGHATLIMHNTNAG